VTLPIRKMNKKKGKVRGRCENADRNGLFKRRRRWLVSGASAYKENYFISLAIRALIKKIYEFSGYVSSEKRQNGDEGSVHDRRTPHHLALVDVKKDNLTRVAIPRKNEKERGGH